MKLKRIGVCAYFMISCLFISVPFSARGDLGDILLKFHPYITAQEEYNDNIDLAARNKKDDWITTIYPGLKFSILPESRTADKEQGIPTAEMQYGMDLDYRLGLVFYGKNTDRNYISHDGTLNAWYTWDRRLTFRVREYLIRSEEPREQEYTPDALPNQYFLSTQRARAIYLRNVFEPSMDYQFGRENRISLNYRSNVYRNQSPLFQNSREDYINPKFTYWFNVRNGISLEYGLTLGHFERSSDLTGHMGTGRYTYRFNPRTSIFGEYTFLRRDFEPPSTDYDVHRPSLGISHQFGPTLSGKAQLGYFWQNPSKGSTNGGLYYDANLSKRAAKTTYTLLFQGGYNEDYFTAENLGFSKYHRVIGTISHRLKERMTVGLSSSFERAKFSGSEIDHIWGIRGDASYRLLKWLTVSLEASHSENRSNIDIRDYSEYRGLFRVTANF